jgi:hypothetical protein
MRPGNGVSPHMRDQFYLERAQSAFVAATSKSARKKKKQPRRPNVLLSVRLRIACPCYPLPFEALTISGLGR